MYEYSIIQWILFFYLYCFLGWCFESAYVSFRNHKLINRGFMRGPFLPLYGSGAIIMLVLSAPYQENLLLTYISGVIGATLLEYLTGVCMELLFKMRYWDYSNQPLNFQGYVCLSSSVAWGFLTILMTKVIHRPIAMFVLAIPNFISTLAVIILTVFIVADFSIAFRTAMDLRDILIRMEKGKEELLRIQKRLDVIIAVMDNTKEGITEEIAQKKEQLIESLQEKDFKTEELVKGIEERLLRVKNAIYEKPSKYLEGIRDEVSELRGKFSLQSDRHYGKVAKDFLKRNLILGNPTMRSIRYNTMLEELKKEIEERKNKK